MSSAKHIPVLLHEAVDALVVKPGGKYVDGTLGRAGHTREILSRGGIVLGIDRDDAAVDAARAYALDGLTVVKGRHGDLKRLAQKHGWDSVDGVLLDLGVSSPQLDEAERGFSFLRDGPLDMRMDRSCGFSAAELVNSASAEELERIFRLWGEEPHARRLAKALRQSGERFETTVQLAEFVERTLGRHGGHHPATRIFQALRMEVNDEMGELERALEGALDVLKPGGRFAVITFESLTDRTVKQFFVGHVGRMCSLQQGGAEWQGTLPRVKAVTHKPLVAGDNEIRLNPRARSAKLRVIEKE